jgi:hypothetical protein
VRSADHTHVDARWIDGGNYQVNVGGTLYPISVSLKPIYDPINARIR